MLVANRALWVAEPRKPGGHNFPCSTWTSEICEYTGVASVVKGWDVSVPSVAKTDSGKLTIILLNVRTVLVWIISKVQF